MASTLSARYRSTIGHPNSNFRALATLVLASEACKTHGALNFLEKLPWRACGQIQWLTSGNTLDFEDIIQHFGVGKAGVTTFPRPAMFNLIILYTQTPRSQEAIGSGIPGN
jgi:hypothetical protein